MYHEFFQLQCLPFENTPDPRFFYGSEQHREALAAIEYTIRMRKGFVLVTGEIGAGKTTVGRTMWRRIGDQMTMVPVTHNHQDRSQLVIQILRAMGVKRSRHDDYPRLLERVRDHAVHLFELGRPAVLFIDEAQTLSDESLEELRLLSNFDTATTKPLQIVLIGQPELHARLTEPTFAALRQRIVMAKKLRALSAEDVAGYIEHRLRVASKDPEQVKASFEDDAVDRIASFTRGVPRLINLVCDNAMLLAFVRERQRISLEMVQRVIADMLPALTSEPIDGAVEDALRLVRSA